MVVGQRKLNKRVMNTSIGIGDVEPGYCQRMLILLS